MNADSGNLRFRCAFSQRGIRKFNIRYGVISISTLLLFGYLVVITGAWFGIVCWLFLVIPSVYYLIYIEKLEEDSYLEITSDGTLRCVYKWCGTAKYPVKEIMSIEAVYGLDRECKVPMRISRNRNDPYLYPKEGVVIYFNRKWIKSIYPVFFNPEDIEGFFGVFRIQESIHNDGQISRTASFP